MKNIPNKAMKNTPINVIDKPCNILSRKEKLNIILKQFADKKEILEAFERTLITKYCKPNEYSLITKLILNFFIQKNSRFNNKKVSKLKGKLIT